MTISFSCSLTQLPTIATHRSASSSPSNTNQVLLVTNKIEGGGIRSCLVGMACVMVGLASSCSQSHEAIAIESTQSSEKIAKWSDKSMCPKWRVNDLETIVRENLPRPSSARRRWEIAGFNTRDSPPVKMVVASRSKGNCFSM